MVRDPSCAEDFACLYRELMPKLERWLARRFGAEAAEDLAQEALSRAWQRRSAYDPDVAEFSAWVWFIARNAGIDHVRATSRANRLGETLGSSLMSTVDADLVDGVIASEDQRSVRRSVARLGRERRDALWYAYWMDQTQATAATTAQVPLGTLKSRIRLALGELRAEMAPQK